MDRLAYGKMRGIRTQVRAKMRMHLRAFGAESDKRIPPRCKQ